MTQSRSNRGGFTLIELLAVMGIMLILATIAVTSYRSMVSGSGITASLGHLRQTLALARQQAIMQGKSAYVVFYTNESWYVTCMAEGTKTYGPADRIIDTYRSDWGQVKSNSILYNLSEDKATFAIVTSTSELPDEQTYQIVTSNQNVWIGKCHYGWEISQRVKLPRGFKFSGNPSSVRFKPDGTAVDAAGNYLVSGIKIYEEIRSNKVYSVEVKYDGSMKVVYPN